MPVRPGDVQPAHLAARLLHLRLRHPPHRHRHPLRVHAAEAVEPGGREAGLKGRIEVLNNFSMQMCSDTVKQYGAIWLQLCQVMRVSLQASTSVNESQLGPSEKFHRNQ